MIGWASSAAGVGSPAAPHPTTRNIAAANFAGLMLASSAPRHGAGDAGAGVAGSTGAAGDAAGTTGAAGTGALTDGGLTDAAADAPAVTDADPLAGWKLSWSQEFNEAAGTKPDPKYWSYDLGGGG